MTIRKAAPRLEALPDGISMHAHRFGCCRPLGKPFAVDEGKEAELCAVRAEDDGRDRALFSAVDLVKRYGPRGTASKAMRLMWQPDVRAAVEGHMAGLCGDLEGIAQRTIEAAVRIAFADLRGVFRADGTAKDMKQIDDDTMAGLAHFGPVVKSCRPVFKVIRHDKLAALGLLLRYVKLLGHDVENIGVDNIGAE